MVECLETRDSYRRRISAAAVGADDDGIVAGGRTFAVRSMRSHRPHSWS